MRKPIDPVEITVDNVKFNCYLESNSIIFVRDGSKSSINDYEIVLGYCHSFVSSKDCNIELQNHLSFYRKALDKINSLKAFM